MVSERRKIKEIVKKVRRMIYDIHDHYGNYKGYVKDIAKARAKAFGIVKGKKDEYGRYCDIVKNGHEFIMVTWIMPGVGAAREMIFGTNGRFTGRYKYYLFNGKTGKTIPKGNMTELEAFF